jgi:hypothetical protein
MRWSRILLWCLPATVVPTILVPMWLVYASAGYGAPYRAVGTGLLLIAFIVFALGCAAALDRGRLPGLLRSALVVGAVALIGWIGMVWLARRQTELLWLKFSVWPTCWAGLMMLIGLLMLPQRRALWWIWLRRATIVLLAVLALNIGVSVTGMTRYDPYASHAELASRWRWENITGRISAVLALLAAPALLATFLSPWLMGLGGRDDGAEASDSYWLQCPRCDAEQQAMTGSHHCSRCGLLVRLEVS